MAYTKKEIEDNKSNFRGVVEKLISSINSLSGEGKYFDIMYEAEQLRFYSQRMNYWQKQIPIEENDTEQLFV
jgi:hypothetical protein